MAKRKSSSSDNDSGCGGCLGLIIVIAIIEAVGEFIMETWSYLLLIAGCIFGIWILVKIFKYLDTQGDRRSRRDDVKDDTDVDKKTSTIVKRNYVPGSNVCNEVDRQIKETLVKRKKLKSEIRRVKRGKVKHSMPWMLNNEHHFLAKEELNEKLDVLKGGFNAAVYTFREPVTSEFNNLKSSLTALFNAVAITHDATTASGQILIPYNPVGDMQYVNFSTDPVCILLEENVFCIIPCYIVHFKRSGAYVSTYTCKAIYCDRTDGYYDERVKHVTWEHTRADGMPDRRYKHNPQRVYYTTSTHTISNMIALEIVNYQLKYEVDPLLKHDLILATKEYSAVLPPKLYDPVFHMVRLLKECDRDNANIVKLESIVNGGDIVVTYIRKSSKAYDSKDAAQTDDTIAKLEVNVPEKPNNVKMLNLPEDSKPSDTEEILLVSERETELQTESHPEYDELIVKAGIFVIVQKKASIGSLQRAFKIGFNRAARIMDQLCELEVVGPEEGTRPRTILMSQDQFIDLMDNLNKKRG